VARRRPAALLLAVTLVVAAACGPSEQGLRRTVAREGVASGAPAAPGVSGEGVPGAVDAGAPAGAGRASSGGVPSIAPRTGSAPRASDRGVTDDSITIGVITTLSGGQRFVGEPPYRMAVAYADELNRRGGINGRKVVVKGYDVCIACPEDGLAQAKRAVEEDHVFAVLNGFVANAALGPAMDYLASTGTPMIQTADGLGLDAYQFQFGLDLPYRGAIDADFVRSYLDQKGLPRKVALLRFSQPLDELISRHQKAGLQKRGVEVVDEVAVQYGAAMTNQSSQVARMRASGASMVVGSHGVVCAFNMQAASQIGWNVPYLCSILYGDFAVSIADDAVEGRDVFADSDGFAPLSRPAPGVARYRDLMRDYYPAGEVGLITMSSFLGMLTFEEGVKAMGDAVTREGLLRHLGSLRGYDAGGLTPPFTVTPTDHIAIHAAYILRLDADRRWQPVSSDWVYPDPVHGLPR
jgi:branched-chain amino acid transport system substrate-binding protein